MSSLAHRANTALASLRRAPFSGLLTEGARLADGVWFSLDQEQGDSDLMLETGGSALLTARLATRRAGRWCALNIDLGNDDLSGLEILGLACRSRAPVSTTARIAIRNFMPGGGHKDVLFAEHLVAFAQESTHCDLLWLSQTPLLRQPAAWRSLLVFLDPQGFDIAFQDLRLFTA